MANVNPWFPGKAACQTFGTSVLFILMVGCTGLQPQQSDPSSTQTEPTQPEPPPPAPTESDLQDERNALFAQPYIDPLTNYLRQYREDSDRAAILSEVKQERDARCAAIAKKFDNREPTAANLKAFKAGYAYSCPEEVAAFADRIDREGLLSDRDSIDDLSQSVKDCYLLTSIKNFTEARKACLEPASNGDAQAQENMAIIEHAFENYTEAFRWAEKIANNSATAAYLLGRMYRDGTGIEVDLEKAGYWLRRAADRGHAKARVMLEAMASESASS